MYKFGPNQTKAETFNVVYWHLLVERCQETYDHQITEIYKQVDWAFGIAVALLSAFLLKGPAQPTPILGKIFLGLLFFSILCGLTSKFWPVKYRYTKPTDTPVRRRLTEMISPTLDEGYFKDLSFMERRFASFDVGAHLSTAVGLGKKVPKKILQGADESVEALKSLLWSLNWKRHFYVCQIIAAFFAIGGFLSLLLAG
jgi:hypothetical protein